MTYNEYLEQAKKLEAQAKSLRKQAEKEKAEAAKAEAQKAQELEASRIRLINALVVYVQAISGKSMSKEETDEIINELDKTLKQIEKEYRALNRIFGDFSDDEMLSALFKSLSK